ncbi:MAG: hypothetical protein AVDCRST_MAG17-603, partial [uncultured Solirubrobacterales bacterium]
EPRRGPVSGCTRRRRVLRGPDRRALLDAARPARRLRHGLRAARPRARGRRPGARATFGDHALPAPARRRADPRAPDAGAGRSLADHGERAPGAGRKAPGHRARRLFGSLGRPAARRRPHARGRTGRGPLGLLGRIPAREPPALPGPARDAVAFRRGTVLGRRARRDRRLARAARGAPDRRRRPHRPRRRLVPRTVDPPVRARARAHDRPDRALPRPAPASRRADPRPLPDQRRARRLLRGGRRAVGARRHAVGPVAPARPAARRRGL